MLTQMNTHQKGLNNNTSLSFHNLKSQKLIKNYNEYQSIHSIVEMAESEHFPLINSEFVRLWLKNQNSYFRKSYLSHLLISGYSRTSKPSLFKFRKVIPLEIENIILLYTNLIFIKIYTQNSYSLLTFDCNFTINNLSKILEIEHGEIFKISTKFDSNFRNIFKNGRYKDFNVNHMLSNSEELYIDIPRQIGSKLTLKEIDDGLDYDEILEFELSFNSEMVTNCASSHFEWLCSLKFGDIVDVYNDEYNEWVEGVIIKRDFDTFHIDCSDISNEDTMSVIQVKTIGCDNLDCLQRRYSHCKQNKFETSSLSDQYNENDNMLLFCDWTYYPILIE
mmetsp:Transcript_28258/g.24966  ORF Transcript_28258/g.24966 Transcript_28258/m.24966 type:complete len:334 (+) Transcript_28258:126-1127(+)